MPTSSVSSIQPAAASVDTHALVKNAKGDFTAASVNANPDLAAGLIKLKDGNYSQPIVASTDRYTAIATDLTTLKLGG